MTSPIKPPGGPKPPVDPAATSKEVGSKGSAEFKKSMEVDELNQASASAIGGLDQVVSDLKSGKINGADAVDHLVAKALEGPMAAKLNDVGKAALEKHLRETLAADPNLSEMVKGLQVD